MKRYFFPSKKGTSIHHWEWTKRNGLRVVFTDGLSCKSGWTLPELLKADHRHGDGLPCVEHESVKEIEYDGKDEICSE